MLDNLKLGSTTGTTTLTPTDSNISSNFILPQVQTGGSASYDTPTVSGPVPGDTGTGATNYGYLYNWSAATAGESRTTHTEADGDAPYSICPANWRLPAGGYEMNEPWYPLPTNEFNTLNANMAGFASGSDPAYLDNYGYSSYYQGWQHNGPFKGTFAGYWWGSFYGQGSYGYLWSRSAFPGWSGRAFAAYFGADGVYPDYDNNRDDGLGVRCLLD
jgi:uncharacterized protein (TIGR02145 family)